MHRRKIICLTPVKNEDWILHCFLSETSKWADHIIIADQLSTDRSLSIARAFPKVIVVKNDSMKFNEPERQKLLIDEARKIPGEKLLIALDADEILYIEPNNQDFSEMLFAAEVGQGICFESVNISRNFDSYWTKGFHYFGLVDDGQNHDGPEIDSPRLPNVGKQNMIEIKSGIVFHLQYTHPERVKYKQLWYQCLEKTLDSELTYLGTRRTNFYLFQRYNKILFDQRCTLSLPEEWKVFLDSHVIPKLNVTSDGKCFYLQEIQGFFDKYGTKHFSELNIWDVDWNTEFDETMYSDPRGWHTKMIHKWLSSRRHMEFTAVELRFISFLEVLGLF